jgi:hypothetical protein
MMLAEGNDMDDSESRAKDAADGEAAIWMGR